MRSSKAIHTVSCHAEGEVGDVIVGGVAPPPGKTLWEQRDHLEADGTLRNYMLNEPRGGVFRHVNLLVPPKDKRADAAFLIMEPEDTPPMSGSNTICVATVLLETGIVPMTEPVTELMLEVPAGLVSVRAECENGQVRSVAFHNVASFADRLDAIIDIPGHGKVRVDTAFGGDSYVLVDAADVGLEVIPENARQLAELGSVITDAANAQLGFSHPANDWNHISFCQFTGPLEKTDIGVEGRNTVVIKPAKLDRSPCGTGSSARIAILHAKGELKVGDVYESYSIIGSRFVCRVESETEIGGRAAIIPSVCGRGYITGTHQHFLNPDDPWPEGYRVSDTWPAGGRYDD